MTYIHLPFLLFLSSTCAFSPQPFLHNTLTKKHAFYRRETTLQNVPFFADDGNDSDDSNNPQDEKSSAPMNEQGSSLASETVAPPSEISTSETYFPPIEVIAEVFLNNSEVIAEIVLNNTKSLLLPLGVNSPVSKDTDGKVVAGAIAVTAGTLLLVSNNLVFGVIGGATGGYAAMKPGVMGDFMRRAGALAVSCVDLAFKASREGAKVKRQEARVKRQKVIMKKVGVNDEILVDKMLEEGRLGFEKARMKEFQKNVDEVLEEAEEELKKVENDLLELNGIGEVEKKDELLDEVENVERMLEEREEDMLKVRDEMLGEVSRMDKEKEEMELMPENDDELGVGVDAQNEALSSEESVLDAKDTQAKDELLEEVFSMAKKEEETQKNDAELNGMGEGSSVKNEVLSEGELDVDSSGVKKFEAESDEILEESEEEIDDTAKEGIRLNYDVDALDEDINISVENRVVEKKDELLDEVKNVERMLEKRDEDKLKVRDELLGEVSRMDKEKEEMELMRENDEELGVGVIAQNEALPSEENVLDAKDTRAKDELLKEFFSMAKREEETQKNDEELEVGIGAEDEAFSSEENVLYNENMQPQEDGWDASIKLAQ